mmetsp:Transcript_13307/g.18179  ORF Transcript_13307/g.18179 Transcript_13307/m.18179 type:complete len:203 (-) Transcript_13307:82-690(-)|eukprot:CAMPEP_0196581230 /NCGR_PEP_ID=MMETSP1081-20130531/33051_1 /TAXON_ID=36882 /ORGANISM="Pyramimonas amylifera, Strain CCMP720" /LENGTH=202 /DNA_ID=CAMNT_0041901373 /DNA_START=138 /DNA_END=746 /DNA_ORIENTATION=+
MFGLLKHLGDAVAPADSNDEGYPNEDPVDQTLIELRRLPCLHTEGFPDCRLEALNLVLPPPPEAAGTYRSFVVIGDMCFLSGQLPFKEDGTLHKGKVSSSPQENEVDEEGGSAAARAAALTTLSLLKKELGTLNCVSRVVKVNGFINCSSDFEGHSKVMNGYTELLVDVFGDAGKPARSAIGVSSLPFNIPVEVEAIFQLSK